MIALLGMGALFSLGMHIAVAVAAFREGVGTGLLALCIPLYALYFVFKTSDSDTLKILYSAAFVINLVLRYLTRHLE
jgi:hypothetical protein